MQHGKEVPLPYRSDAAEIARWVDARARGRDLEQTRALGFSSKSFDGIISTAQALGLAHAPDAELTESGREFALAAEEGRRHIMRRAIMEFEPYALPLEALLGRELPTVTELDWIETWWASHGYGTSESNRGEASTVLARLLDYIGAGSYIQGRRGHPTRIRWSGRAKELLARPETTPPTGVVGATPLPPADESPRRSVADGAVHSLAVELRPGRVARLTVPSVLTQAEKTRLLSLLDLLISVEAAS